MSSYPRPRPTLLADPLSGPRRLVVAAMRSRACPLRDGDGSAPIPRLQLITFPIMIGFCGVAFYVVLLLNGISTDRGPGTVQDDPMLAYATGELLEQWIRAVA